MRWFGILKYSPSMAELELKVNQITHDFRKEYESFIESTDPQRIDELLSGVDLQIDLIEKTFNSKTPSWEKVTLVWRNLKILFKNNVPKDREDIYNRYMQRVTQAYREYDRR
mgnify:CR=1 FL=1